jgi:hypothetical protein
VLHSGCRIGLTTCLAGLTSRWPSYETARRQTCAARFSRVSDMGIRDVMPITTVTDAAPHKVVRGGLVRGLTARKRV